jgi:hypothetical protein
VRFDRETADAMAWLAASVEEMRAYSIRMGHRHYLLDEEVARARHVLNKISADCDHRKMLSADGSTVVDTRPGVCTPESEGRLLEMAQAEPRPPASVRRYRTAAPSVAVVDDIIGREAMAALRAIELALRHECPRIGAIPWLMMREITRPVDPVDPKKMLALFAADPAPLLADIAAAIERCCPSAAPGPARSEAARRPLVFARRLLAERRTLLTEIRFQEGCIERREDMLVDALEIAALMQRMMNVRGQILLRDQAWEDAIALGRETMAAMLDGTFAAPEQTQ